MKSAGKKADQSRRRKIASVEIISDNIKRTKLTTSDHAFVRYLERGLEVDVESQKRKIARSIAGAVRQCGDGEYPFEGDVSAKVANNVIVTVID